MLTPSLVLAILAGGVPPAQPLQGCVAEQVVAGWNYTCAGLDAFSKEFAGVREEPGAALKKFLDAPDDGPDRLQFQRLELGGETATVARLRQDGRTWINAALRRPEGLRILLCEWKQQVESECIRVLEVLATQPWGAGPVAGSHVRAPPRLTIAGRVVPIPSGCLGEQTPELNRIRCATGSAFWGFVTTEDNARQILDDPNEWERLQRQFGKNLKRDSVPCRLGGLGTTCVRTRLGVGRMMITTLDAYVRNDQRFTIAHCDAPGTTGEAAPCSAIFDLR